MFKAVFVCVILIVATSATHYEDLELNNLIEYGESPYGGFVVPYPYQDQLQEQVVLKPLYSEVIVPAVPALPATAVVSEVAEVGFSKLGLITKAASFALGLVKTAVFFVIAKAPALILGTLAAFGICKFTPICSKLSSVESLYEVPIELRSYATPERLAKATEFVKKAIRKYRSLQEEH
ncbi:uncharacterized protein LOC114361872 [Ostrinia furnacalis]|uniref:uncharacterized protein LOC114361872 n=1 Tax=Ostrinia furnacalis TaxID=93504 RepID=UPI00103A607C|nr:uncharacterized protein LOC114361872 [Ostrinia furnacalis]